MRRFAAYSSTVNLGSSGEVPLEVPDAGVDGFEIADLGRLGRRALRGIVRSARADSAETLRNRIAAHLGDARTALSVVRETWPVYDQVNVQLGLDDWMAEREHELLGVANYQHHEFGLAELIGGPPQPFGPALGTVARVNIASGPGGQVTACVACGVYLITDGSVRAALLLRAAAPNMGRPVLVVEIASSDPEYSASAVQ